MVASLKVLYKAADQQILIATLLFRELTMSLAIACLDMLRYAYALQPLQSVTLAPVADSCPAEVTCAPSVVPGLLALSTKKNVLDMNGELVHGSVSPAVAPVYPSWLSGQCRA